MKHKKIFPVFVPSDHRSMHADLLWVLWRPHASGYLGVNTWWLEGYYVDQKLKVMEQAYTDIDNAIQEKVGENENIGDVLRGGAGAGVGYLETDGKGRYRF
ncbi:MAG: hypothetical protein ACLUD2_12080 [Clostridium sp.]